MPVCPILVELLHLLPQDLFFWHISPPTALDYVVQGFGARHLGGLSRFRPGPCRHFRRRRRWPWQTRVMAPLRP